jgi:hypothetical protein
MTARDQSDAVALAVDNVGWPSPTATKANPFRNVTFIKNAIASGSITPPSGEGASTRRSDFITGLCVICMLTLGVGIFFALGLFWRH